MKPEREKEIREHEEWCLDCHGHGDVTKDLLTEIDKLRDIVHMYKTHLDATAEAFTKVCTDRDQLRIKVTELLLRLEVAVDALEALSHDDYDRISHKALAKIKGDV